MAVDLREYQRLKDKADRLAAEAQRAEGARAQLLKQLKKETGCGTVEEAEKMLAGLEKEERKLAAKFEKAMAAFRERWEGKLDD